MARENVPAEGKSGERCEPVTLSKRELIECLNQISDWLYSVKLAVEGCDCNKFPIVPPIVRGPIQASRCRDSEGC